jgi:hypothetical protein
MTLSGHARRCWSRRWGCLTSVRSSHIVKDIASVLIFAASIFASQPAPAQFIQQGAKLVGTGASKLGALQGAAVAISADGNTAILGAPGSGAAWIFTRSGGAWKQQAMLSGFEADSVALSADGNTAIMGSPYVNHQGGSLYVGAASVFIRSGGVWSQQGADLVGSIAFDASQGWSVALSADGNTAIVGGPADNGNIGAAWVYTRSAGVWTQQGQKLVGTGYVGGSGQGTSVALSADGNTAVMGAPGDNNFVGAVWVFTRSGGVWSQQGQKLVGTGYVGLVKQGSSIALSSDGNTFIFGGPGDNTLAGAAWVFTRSSGVWTQQGSKLVGTGAVGAADQGWSVALSGDGNTALVGGPGDQASCVGCWGIGATWVFSRGGGVWTQPASKLVGTGYAANPYDQQGWSVALSADGTTAIVGGPSDNPQTNYGLGAAWVFVRSSQLLAAVLPEGRSAQPKGTVTAFATIINTGTTTATSCSIAPAGGPPATFVYQTTNSATNALTGSPNTAVDIAAKASQSFVIAFTPSAAIAPTNEAFIFTCTNVPSAPIVFGLNTLLLSASTTPTPDVIALGATLQNDGIVHVVGTPSTGVFAVATDNLGSADTITVATNSGTATLPITVTLCQTNPTTGACLLTPSATVTTTINPGATPTFGIFVSASGKVAFDPANNRIYVTFSDSTNAIRGETSVAVETQ